MRLTMIHVPAAGPASWTIRLDPPLAKVRSAKIVSISYRNPGTLALFSADANYVNTLYLHSAQLASGGQLRNNFYRSSGGSTTPTDLVRPIFARSVGTALPLRFRYDHEANAIDYEPIPLTVESLRQLDWRITIDGFTAHQFAGLGEEVVMVLEFELGDRLEHMSMGSVFCQ